MKLWIKKRLKPKYLLKALGFFLLISVLLIGVASVVVYYKKDFIISKVIEQANTSYQGLVLIDQADISPFKNFPYVSVKIDNFQIYETKSIDTLAVVDVEECYVGFDFWKIIKNDFQIKKIVLNDGFVNIIQYQDNTYNISRAFAPLEDDEEVTDPFALDLQSIELSKIDIKKNNLETHIMVESDVQLAKVSFKTNDEKINFHLDGEFVLNVFKDFKPTYIYHKNLELHTDLEYVFSEKLVYFKTSELVIEGAQFDLTGTIDLDDDMNLDLKFSGNKPNFDLLIAFAPEDLIPVLRGYDNRGQVYFDATIKGKSINNHNPEINANFGCQDGYIKNSDENKVLDLLGFNCSFTNGKERNAKTSVFELKDFGARPEAGKFKAKLKVINFESPEIDMQLDSNFDLEFLTKFFKLKDLKNLTGQVLLSMNFHDIIDLQQPEKALEKLNQAYYSKLIINNLNFKSDSYHLPIKNMNVEASITGEDLSLTNCSFSLGENDMAISGKIVNIPAVLHKSSEVILAELHLKSNKLDVKNLMPDPKNVTFDEVITNLKFDLNFKGKANTFITSNSLPIGNYYLTDISANLKNYQHKLNHFNGVFYIDQQDVKIKRFDGKIDTSDFHFEGKIGHYDLWLSDNKAGDTEIDFDLVSNEIHFKDIFTYKGNNFMPEEYRNEDIKKLKLHGHVSLHYMQNELKSTDFYLTNLEAQLKMHPLNLYGFNGNVHLENNILKIKDFSGNLGNNDFKVNGTYHTANPKAVNTLNVQSKRLNFNEIITYNPPDEQASVDHDAVPNIFEKPFPNIKINAKVNDLQYQKYHLTNLTGQLEIKENHYVLLNQLQFNTADGLVNISGYFDGLNPNKIYLNPDIKMQGVDLDKMLFKFDNFGQDMMVSDNLHGKLTGRITGKILLHTDLTPMINQSDLQIDARVENGRLDNFAPMQAMADFFGDKNLNRIKFDVLENRFKLSNGALSFPNMNINSSLGYIELSGSQSIDLNMDYYIRVPLKLVGKAAFSKLFNRKPKDISPDQEDELIIRDTDKKTRFINVRMQGKPNDYKISLQKNKDIKAGNSFQKTDDFLFDKLESEFEDDED